MTESASGQLTGVEAIVDKDYVAALLGIAAGAERLIVLTDVCGVKSDFGTPQAELIPYLDADELDGIQLPDGSMGPKVEACRRFAIQTGGTASIGALADARELVAGITGTTIAAARQQVTPHRG